MKYETEKICFGEIFYDLGHDGVYFSSPQAFEKIVVNDEVEHYMSLSGKRIYNKCPMSNGNSNGVVERASLTSLMKDTSKKLVSRSMINLYLLKYMILSSKNEKRYIELNEAEKSK